MTMSCSSVVLRYALLMGCVLSGSLSAQALYSITAEQWSQPRSGERVMALPAIEPLLQGWRDDPTQRIEVLYPGGESGVLWAKELQDWLVALGTPSAQIQIRVGSQAANRLQIKILTFKE
ncbi:MAG: hypothetical protein Q9O24_07465 [Gammaproteobacteria bacterium]|nr:hypothetical protein [Gammaproteobacteria bacterium]